MIISTRIKSYNAKNFAYQIRHDLRLTIPDYVDKKRLDKNEYYLFQDNERESVEEWIKKEWKKVEVDFKKHNNRKLRKDASLIIEGILTFSKDARDYVNDEENFQELDKKAIEFVRKLEKIYNTKAIYVARHSDETTTHYHFSILNYDYKNHKTIRASLKKRDCSNLQDLAGEVFKELGFNRGKYKAARIREAIEKGEKANITNWGSVASIHQKLLEEVAELSERQKNLIKKIEKNQRLVEKKENQLEKLKQMEKESIKKIEKAQKTLNTYLNRIEKAKKELEEVEKQLEERLKNLESLKLKLEEENEELKYRLEEMQEKVKELSNENKALKEKQKTFDNLIDKLKSTEKGKKILQEIGYLITIDIKQQGKKNRFRGR